MKNFKIKLQKYSKWLLILFSLILVLELLSKLIVFIGYGHLKKPSEVIRDDNLNTYVELLEQSSKCNYYSSLFPHPYLGWVYWNNPYCHSDKWFNSDGFRGPEFPITNEENYFDILITGGSVSGQFGPGKPCEDKKNIFCRDFLGEVLKDYKSTENKKIRVFNAGVGAYKHPHQSIVATLYGRNFDLIISIEGFNEHYMLNDKVPNKFSEPANNFIISTSDFYINNGLNKIIIDFILFYKNLANKFKIINNSHLHSLSYRTMKLIADKTVLTENNRRKAFSNLWQYNRKDLSKLDIEKFKYENLVSLWRSFIAASSSNGAKGIIIVHPVPQLFKNLTDHEKKVSAHRNYKEIFLRMAEEAKKLRLNENLMVYDFLKIFEDYNETLYTDHSHMNFIANEIMAENIKKILILNKLIKKIN